MSSSSSSSDFSSIENAKLELFAKKRFLEREERIQKILREEDTIRHLERCSMQYLYEQFYPDAPLPDDDAIPIPEIISNDIGQQDDETVFFPSGDTHFSFLTRWSRHGYGMFLTSADRHNNVLRDAVSVNSPHYFFDRPIVFPVVDLLPEVDCVEKYNAIYFRRTPSNYDLSLLYRTLEGKLTFLSSEETNTLTNVLHVGTVPWKLAILKHEEGFIGVMFQNLHAPEVKCRYILHEKRRFFPCILEGVHYYVVASQREDYVDLVRFADNTVVKSFFTGGAPRQVICCTGYLVVVCDSFDEGLVSVTTLYLA